MGVDTRTRHLPPRENALRITTTPRGCSASPTTGTEPVVQEPADRPVLYTSTLYELPDALSMNHKTQKRSRTQGKDIPRTWGSYLPMLVVGHDDPAVDLKHAGWNGTRSLGRHPR